MGTTHLRSNLKGQDGTQHVAAFATATIGNVEATNLKVNTAATITAISANDITATDCDFDYVKVNITATILAMTGNKVTATYIKGGTSATIAAISANSVTATTAVINSYIEVGTRHYIFFGTETAEANIVAAATAVHASPATGCLYISAGAGGGLWVFDDNDTATQFQTY